MQDNPKPIYRHLPLLFVLLNLIMVPLVYTPWTLDPSLTGRFIVWSLVLLVFAIYVYIKRDQLLAHAPPINNLVVRLYLFYLLFAGVSIFFAINKSEAIVEWFKLFVVFAFIMLGVIILSRHKDFSGLITKFLIVFVFIHALIGLIQFYLVISEVDYNHQISYLINGVSAHRNLYSQILLLGLPFSLYGLIKFKGFWKILGILSSLSAFMLIIVLLTKTVWIAFLLAAVSTILLFINYYDHFKANKKHILRLVIGVVSTVLIVGAVFIFYSKLDSWETLSKQTLWLRNYKFGSSLERVDLWQKSMEMYRDNVFTGVGQGNWRIALPKYGTDGLRSEGGQIFFNRPHNDFFGVLAEIGILGFLFYAAIFVGLLNLFFKITKSKASREDKIFSLFVFSSYLSFLIISMLSFPKERAEHNILLGLIFIIVILLNNKIKRKKDAGSKRFAKILLLGIIVILGANIYINIERYRAEYYLKLALIDREKGNWDGVLENTSKGASYFYTLDNTSIPVTWYKASAYFNNGNIETAFQYFEKALSYHPFNLHVLNNLATCYEIKGNHEKAIELYNATLKISSRFEDALLNLIVVYYNMQQTDVAFDVLEKVDIKSEHPKFDRTLQVLIKSRVETIQNKIEDEDLKVTVERISNDDNWFKKVYQHARENTVHFDEQIVKESIYVMRVMDSTINSNRADYLQEKYVNKRFW